MYFGGNCGVSSVFGTIVFYDGCGISGADYSFMSSSVNKIIIEGALAVYDYGDGSADWQNQPTVDIVEFKPETLTDQITSTWKNSFLECWIANDYWGGSKTTTIRVPNSALASYTTFFQENFSTDNYNYTIVGY